MGVYTRFRHAVVRSQAQSIRALSPVSSSEATRAPGNEDSMRDGGASVAPAERRPLDVSRGFGPGTSFSCDRAVRAGQTSFSCQEDRGRGELAVCSRGAKVSRLDSISPLPAVAARARMAGARMGLHYCNQGSCLIAPFSTHRAPMASAPPHLPLQRAAPRVWPRYAHRQLPTDEPRGVRWSGKHER